MIRFSCETCKKSLRAPTPLAGKKGRCARCGAVNLVPHSDETTACRLACSESEEALTQPVDVKRAPPPSPFRSTADVPVNSTIEGAIQLENPNFSSTARATAVIDEHSTDALAIVVHKTASPPDEAAIIHSPAPRPAPIPTSVVRIGDARDVLQTLAAEFEEPFTPTFEPRPVNLAQAVRAALVVGAVLGFCVGLIASKWLL